MDAKAVEREALRLYRRYATEIVEALGFCPWAEQAREQGQVQPRVVLVADSGPAGVEEVARVAAAVAGDEETDIGLLILPLLDLDRRGFARFTAQVREVDEAHHGRGQAPMAMADFHPQASPDTRSPERLVPFIRCSPDPTIQLVRHSALKRVRISEHQGTSFVDVQALASGALPPLSQVDPLHARIARANLRTVHDRGVSWVVERIEAIHADRHRTYRALGLLPACWQPEDAPEKL